MKRPVFDPSSCPLAGTNLLEASAGTGKTYALAALYLRLVVEAGLPAGSILVVTFTVAATEELRGRIRERLARAEAAFAGGAEADPDDAVLQTLLGAAEPVEARRRLAAALADFDDAPVSTIHGFCQRALAENAFESGLLFGAELVADQTELRREVAEDFWRRRFAAGPALPAALARQRGLGNEALRELLREFAAHPGVRVLPRADAAEVERREAALTEAFVSLQVSWAEVGPEAATLLRGASGLSRSQENYRADVLEADLSNLGLCLSRAPGEVPSDAFGSIDKFDTERLARATVKGAEPPRHTLFDRCRDVVRAREAFFTALTAAFLTWAAGELRERKRAANVQGFDDLLLNLRDALAGPGGPALAETLRAKYRAALVDEFQDTDPLQYEIFRTVFGDSGRSALFLIGDPKQAIYGFRGADVFAYLDAARRVETSYTLGVNRRSEPELVDAVGRVFSRAPAPFLLEAIDFPPVSPTPSYPKPRLSVEGEPRGALRLWFVDRTEENGYRNRIKKGWAAEALPRLVAAEAARLLHLGAAGRARLGERPLEAGDLAVLVRKNEQAAAVQSALRALGVPSVLHSTASLFSCPEAAEMQRVVEALGSPWAEGRVRAALATDLLGADGLELFGLLDDEGAWERRLALFREGHERWARAGLLPALRRLMAEAGVAPRLLSFPDGERRLTNAQHLAEVLHRTALEERLGMDALAAWLRQRRLEAEEGGGLEEHQLRLESDARAVQLVTVHRSKGLEYPVVFVPFAWDTRDPPKERTPVRAHAGAGEGSLVLDLGSSDWARHRDQAQLEALAEDLRLTYVALTRARSRCYLALGAFSGFERSAPAYLLHGPTEGGDPRARAAAASAKDDGSLRADLQSLVRESCGTIEIQDPPPSSLALLRFGARGADLSARRFGGRIRQDWGIASFTSLTAAGPGGAREGASEEPDRDEGRASGGAPAGAEPAPPGRGTPAALADFPRGRRSGDFLHEVLEAADFEGGGGSGLEDLVRAGLRSFRFEPRWLAPVCETLRRAFAAPLEPGRSDFALERVPRRQRLHEVEFCFPLRWGAGNGRPLTAPGLAEAVRSLGGAELGGLAGADLHLRLGRLEFLPVLGYLRGFIDLVFQFENKWYLVDWKSNYLGSNIEDYALPALARTMARDHYVLQYLLYAVALHRHLSARLPGYDYDAHFGGVFYLFLRGVDESGERGIFRHRPRRELVEGLSDYLGGTNPGGRAS